MPPRAKSRSKVKVINILSVLVYGWLSWWAPEWMLPDAQKTAWLLYPRPKLQQAWQYSGPQTKKSEPPHCKTNKMTVQPEKTQISLGIHPVWTESSLCAQWTAKDPSFLHKNSEDSDQTGRMPRLIWVFPGHTCHCVGFVMRRLIW